MNVSSIDTDIYEPVIGLEVHAQLRTRAKAFCGCSTEFGKPPNHNVCPICLGMPGVLPVLNKKLVEFILLMGLATHCSIAPRSTFARKNYFYPDLPKGYQISQYEEPICRNGYIEIELDDGSRKKIGIARIHMEEDAGKSIHDQHVDSLIDINRCGVPLIEIVSEPHISSAREAYLYLTQIRQIVTYLGICDGNMEEGSLRCDANVSVRKKGQMRFGTKTEVKNMNSFRFVERALEYEITRQIDVLESGGEVIQQTMLWSETENRVIPMRSKEEAHDYRYFPEPDLVPVVVGKEWVEELRRTIPELPTERRDRFIREYGLPKYDADILTVSRDRADYYEKALSALSTRGNGTYKAVSNWIMGEVLRVANEMNVDLDQFPIPPHHIGELVNLIEDGTISSKIAKDVFTYMVNERKSPAEVVKEKGLVQLTDTGEIERVIQEVIDKHPQQVADYRGGKLQVRGFLVGQVMRATGGKANPRIVQELLTKILDAE